MILLTPSDKANGVEGELELWARSHEHCGHALALLLAVNTLASSAHAELQ